MKQISLKKNTIANYVGQIYTMLIGVFMLPFYLEHLGAEAYGLVGFFTMLSSLMMLFDMGFSSALTRETAKLKDKNNGFFELKLILRSIESMILILSIFIFIAIFFASPWLSKSWLQIEQLSLSTVENCVKIMGFMVAIRWYVGLYSGLIVGLEQQIWLNVFKTYISTLKFLGGLILIIFISDNIFNFFIYQGVISILELIILNNKVYKNLPKNIFIFPSIQAIKNIAPFALGLAYTSGVWIIFTQVDKLLLSHYIPLEKYGFFALVISITNAIMQMSTPISQAILPRMVVLLSNGNEIGMLELYRKSTQYISIIMFSTVGIVAFYSYDLLYSWTGNIEAASWTSSVLSWYALGNGILAFSAFQYYLQFAHGNLEYHIKFNTYFPILSLPIIFYSVSSYGAIGAAISWFFIQTICFIIWPPFIHSKFAKGLHKKWIISDIFPSFLVTGLYLFVLKIINIDFHYFTRVETIIILLALGLFLLFLNALSYSRIRKIFFKNGVISV